MQCIVTYAAGLYYCLFITSYEIQIPNVWLLVIRTPYPREHWCGDPWLFFEIKRSQRAKKFGKRCCRTIKDCACSESYVALSLSCVIPFGRNIWNSTVMQPSVYCLSAVYCLMSTVYCQLPVWCLLPTVYCLMSTVYFQLPVWCLLPTA
jgi:hypothetical protein